MNRREIREQIFKMLFQTEFYGQEEMEEQIRLFMQELEEKDETKEIIWNKNCGIFTTGGKKLTLP
ncbi:hypothetical protein C823_000668 [Eubacterium plexicaudatum ASF492]|nr:hypothetical protein C823_000668 [Eubacterium plexicaudatum ASF492]